MLDQTFSPVIENLVELCTISEGMVDLEALQIYLATFWGSSVLEPERVGLNEKDLESLHDYLNWRMAEWLGQGYGLRDCFGFLNSKAGEEALSRYHVNPSHKEFLARFTRLILQEAYQQSV